MAAKNEHVAQLLAKVDLGWAIPAPLEQASLLEQGMYAVLQRHFDAKRAAAAIKSLKAYYPDWNELRVAQSQEVVEAGKLGARGVAAARDVREYLQEVFQLSHGLNLEFLRDDPQATARFASSVSFIGLGRVHYLMWLAQNGELPVSGGLVRVLDRLGLVARTASLKKAREALKPVIPATLEGTENPGLEFAVRLGEVASRWCDARKPLCHLCVLVEDCRHGKKVFRDWKVAAAAPRGAARARGGAPGGAAQEGAGPGRARRRAGAEEGRRGRAEAPARARAPGQDRRQEARGRCQAEGAPSRPRRSARKRRAGASRPRPSASARRRRPP